MPVTKQTNQQMEQTVPVDDLIDRSIREDAQFKDNFQTQEQKNRDSEITKLLRRYVLTYSEKTETQKKYRKILFSLCSGIIGLFSVAFFGLLLYFGFHSTSTNIPGVVSLISICITFLVSILGLMQIITKYCFPENDEEYITKIVETIQTNDLSHKLANMKSPTDTSVEQQTEKTP